MEHPNSTLVRRMFTAFRAGDMDAIEAVLAPGCHYRVGGRSIISGLYVGPLEIVGFLSRMLELTDGTYTPTVHDILVNDHHTVALMAVDAERNGVAIAYDVMQIAHIDDGVVQEVWSTPADPYTSDPFWGYPPGVELPRP